MSPDAEGPYFSVPGGDPPAGSSDCYPYSSDCYPYSDQAGFPRSAQCQNPYDDHGDYPYSATQQFENALRLTSDLVQRPNSRPLRVIHVGQYMVRAGIESWLKSLVRYADPQKLKFVRCVVTSPLSDPRVMREMPIPVEVGGKESVRRAAQDCDILLVSGPGEVGGWLQGIRPAVCVGVAHGDAMWTQNILDRCRPAFDHVIAVSRAVQQRVCAGFPSTVIYNAIDTAHLIRTKNRGESRARFGFAPDDYVVGGVMRLSSEKHPELLIQAIAKLPRRFKLFLVGWGALRQKLLDLANDIAPLRCVITPAEDNLGDYYQVLDAFCLPSESEGFGLATLEAQFCGLPVITTQTGYAPELLENGVQFLQCELNADSIARQVALLEANPRWAQSIGLEGQRRAEEFGYATRMCREYETLFAQLFSRRMAARP
ncbi:MAG: glycosyltransferase family 4 protein [Pirellulales bacterium]